MMETFPTQHRRTRGTGSAVVALWQQCQALPRDIAVTLRQWWHTYLRLAAQCYWGLHKPHLKDRWNHFFLGFFQRWVFRNKKPLFLLTLTLISCVNVEKNHEKDKKDKKIKRKKRFGRLAWWAEKEEGALGDVNRVTRAWWVALYCCIRKLFKNKMPSCTACHCPLHRKGEEIVNNKHLHYVAKPVSHWPSEEDKRQSVRSPWKEDSFLPPFSASRR